MGTLLQNSWIQLFINAFTKWQKDNCMNMGAALAYYALFSIFPLMILVLTIVGIVLGPTSGARENILQVMPEAPREMIAQILDRLNENAGSAGLIGLFTLLLGASGAFGVLDQSFNRIWDVEPVPQVKGWLGSILTFLIAKLFSFLVVISCAFFMMTSLVLSTVITYLNTNTPWLPGGSQFWQWVQFVASLAVIAIVFMLMFKYMPDTYVAWADVWLGAIISALLFNLLQKLIGLYFATTNFASYGAVGSVMALLAWIYFTSMITFLGGEISHAYAFQFGSRRLHRQLAEADRSVPA